jgi:23S rRNA (guanosine2251-2'-O)-methyltransferase
MRAEARRRGVFVEEVDKATFSALVPEQSTQGVAAEVGEQPAADLEDLIAAAGAEPSFLLLLDQIQDPHNVGALIRTANAAGVHGVILPERRAAPLSGTVAKASAGAVVFTPTARAPNLVGAMDRLRRSGVWTMGLDDSARVSIYEADLTAPLALVIGGESAGLRRLTREHCDSLLRIPMTGAVESLNASVAGAIAMYEVVRQRRHATVQGTARRVK